MHVIARVGSRAAAARLAAAGILLAIVPVLAGCASDSSHDFDRVDALGRELAVEQCGDVVYTGHFGSTAHNEGDPPSLVLVVVRDTQTIDCVTARFAALGYTDAQYGWFRDTEGAHVTVTANELAAGGHFMDASGAAHAVTEPGIALLIRSA